VALDGMEVVATLALPGRPRWALYDGATDRIYANIQAPSLIAVIDAERLDIVDTLIARRAHIEPGVGRVVPLRLFSQQLNHFAPCCRVPAAGPHGMGIVGEYLFCAADANALVVLERDSGAVVRTLDLPGVPDVVMVDPELAHLYVAIGDPGVVCVFDTSRIVPLETVPTERGAHTLALNPAQHTAYVFQPQSSGAAVFVDTA
jgi:DNA-binding beta-propeller fold protein YncE